MKKVILVLTAVIITSCASNVIHNPIVTYEQDTNLKYQNSICTLIGDAENFDKRYFTYGYHSQYARASIKKLIRQYGEKMMAKYPFYYSTEDFLSGLFKLEKHCDKDNAFIIIDDVELRQNFINLGKMGSSKVEYYVIMTVNINGNNKKTYTALSSTPKYNSFTSNRKFENYILEAKKAAFKNIFRQIDANIKQFMNNKENNYEKH